MIKHIALITLLLGSVYVASANNYAANCLSATRKSQFPSGDEKARADFCVRMEELLAGITNVESVVGLCDVNVDSSDYSSAKQAADAAGDGSNATLVSAALTAYNTAIKCDDASSKQDDIMDTLKEQLKENNLVVKTSKVNDLKVDALNFVDSVAESLFLQKHVQEKIAELTQEEGSARTDMNDADASISQYIDQLVADLQGTVAGISDNKNKNGELTARQIQNVLYKVTEKVNLVKETLDSAESLAGFLKDTLSKSINKVKVFQAISEAADDVVDSARAAFVVDSEAVIIDAWNNFELLSTNDADDATLDPNA